MIPLASSGMVVGLISQVDTLMGSFANDGYNALASALKMPFAALAALFITLMGYGITHGFIKAPLQELYKMVFRLGVIFFFAMNWGNFSFYVVGLFDRGAGELASVVMKATHTPMAGKSIAAGLQSVLNEVFQVGWSTMKLTSLKNWWPYYTALFIWLTGIAVVAVALFEIIVAKVMLSVCMAMAPLFLTLTLFDKTRSFFDRWLGAVVGFSLVLIFVSAVVGLCMTLVHASIADLLNETSKISQLSFAPIFLVACLAIPCLFQAASIAKHIGGACHTAGGGAVVGGLIGSSMGAAVSLNQINKVWQGFREEKSQRGLRNDLNNNHHKPQVSTRGEI